MGLFLMIVFMVTYFGVCVASFLDLWSGVHDASYYFYSLHPSKYLETYGDSSFAKIVAIFALIISCVYILFISKSRMKRFEYEYETGKIEEKKYNRKRRQRVSLIIWVIVFSLLPLAGQLIHMSENGTYHKGCYFAYELQEHSEDEDTFKEKVCYITDVEALPFVTKIEIPETIDGYRVAGIGDEAFEHYRSLKDVTIPNSITWIGANSFCTQLKNVRISNLKSWCAIEFRDNPLMGAENLYLDNKKVTDLVIPEGVIEISDGAFKDCTFLKNVVLPNSVEKIGERAFASCGKLETITIGDGVTYIGAGAFNCCSALKGVYISNLENWCGICFGISSHRVTSSFGFSRIEYDDPDSNPLYYAHNLYINGELVTELVIPKGENIQEGLGTAISPYVFYNYTSLTSVTISDNVTNIGECAFYGCEALTSFTFEGTVAQWNAIKFGKNWNHSVPATEVICSDGIVYLD